MNKYILIILLVCQLGFIAACGSSNISPEAGQNLAVLKGCSACHTIDDAPKKVGPTWKGLYGSQVELEGGSIVLADEAYLRESVLDPPAKIVKDYNKGSMPKISVNEEELASLIAYIKTLE